METGTTNSSSNQNPSQKIDIPPPRQLDFRGAYMCISSIRQGKTQATAKGHKHIPYP